MFLTAARLDDSPEPLEPYLRDLGVVQALRSSPLRFRAPVTVITGENGVGKSTLIEALAVGMRANPEGGSRHARFQTVGKSVSPLGPLLTLSRRENPRDVFFLRGESYLNVARYYEDLDPAPRGGPRMDDLLEMSHGQGLMALIERRFHDHGLFLLDEPEAGLSFDAQLRLVAMLFELADRRGAQVVMATHSPILASVPGAAVYELTDSGMTRTRWEDLTMVDHHRRYLDAPERYLRHLLE